MRKLILKMTAITEKEIKTFFKSDHAQAYFAADISIASQARILMNALSDKFDQIFNLGAKPLADDMVDDVDGSSATALRLSLKQLSGGLTIKTDQLTGELSEIFKATVAENVGLIKSIASQYLDGVQGAVMRSITTGNGLQDLVPFLQKHEGITLRRARNIARDQTKKAFSNLNRVRMVNAGVKKFEWLHSSGGQTPRQLQNKQ